MTVYKIDRGGKIHEFTDREEALAFIKAPVTEDELLDEIRAMSYVEMARLYRFGSIGDPRICGEIVGQFFHDRFNELGGMTPAMSKRIGWEK